MSVLDREHRSYRVRLIIVGAIALAAAGLLARTTMRSDEGSGGTDRPTQVEAERVYSGDTIQIDGPEVKVIYAGIRAPEEDEPLYEESKRRNAELVKGEDLRLRFDEKERDQKDRMLSYAFVGDRFVNEVLVCEGLAYVRLTNGTRRFADRLLAAQTEARQERRGIWARAPRSREPQYPADPKYGNFHRPSCEEVPKIKPERLVTFGTSDEAYEKGYAPCVHCSP